MTERAARLVAELEENVGLSAVDAHRGAFTALAVSAGWPNARIGRYLGVTRARVGQRISKLVEWAERGDCQTLEATLENAPEPNGGAAGSVGFTQADWVDLEFAQSIIDTVGDGVS